MSEPHTADLATRYRYREEGRELERERIIKLLDSGEHVAQFEFENQVFKSAWKQKCRCGYYGVFNEHLIALIKGEK